jgi:hypothetical protein
MRKLISFLFLLVITLPLYGSGVDWWHSPEADSIPFDPGTTDLTSTEVGPAIRELRETVSISASPGYTWGKGGSAGPGEYLYNEDVECNKAGRVVPFSDAVLRHMFVSNSESVTCTLRLYEHQGGSMTFLAQIALTSERSKSAQYTVSISQNHELCIKVQSGDCKDPIVGAIISGSSI